MSRRADMEQNLRMECTYIVRGHARRRQMAGRGLALPAGERAKCAAVERALCAVEPELREAVLLSVCDRVSYERLNVPCSRQTFYRNRHALLLGVARQLGYLDPPG